MTVKTVSREFETVFELENVRLRVPENFKSECRITPTNINLDGNIVADAEHYYSGVPLGGGTYLNRHYYFPKPPLIPVGMQPIPLGKSVVARVSVEIEKFKDGRRFTMLRIYVYAEPRRAGFHMKINQAGTEGIPIEGTKGKILFEMIEQKEVEVTETAATE